MSACTVRVPGDKSISHRALILAALAEGESVLRNLLPGDDVQSTARALRALGVDVPELPQDGGVVRVRGVGLRGLRAPAEPIDCGNSGTTVRLLIGALAGLPLSVVLTGDASLRARPMRRVTAPLAAAGAAFDELDVPDRLPLRVRGAALQPIAHDSPHASAQVKSALLLAGLTAGVNVRVREPLLSRDHTERMLRAQGARLDAEAGDEGWFSVRLAPPPALRPLDLSVPGDFSSAAFFLALGALGSRELGIDRVGVNPTRTGMLAVLERAGAVVERLNRHDEAGEPVADLVVRGGGPLEAVSIGADEVPGMIDELPVIAALAARARGTSVIRGAQELRVKETDRIAALAANLRALGVHVEEHEDGLSITGTDEPLRGHVRSFGDHRIAMAFAVLAVLPGNAIDFDDRAVVTVSFPDFWAQLEACAGREAA
jgi:3-phosphoshikimate 1-carboxyvinyltransferase